MALMNTCEACGNEGDLALDPNKGLIWVCRSCAEAMYQSPAARVEDIMDTLCFHEVYDR
jgi:ribosomal protein L37AE/L43A